MAQGWLHSMIHGDELHNSFRPNLVENNRNREYMKFILNKAAKIMFHLQNLIKSLLKKMGKALM